LCSLVALAYEPSHIDGFWKLFDSYNCQNQTQAASSGIKMAVNTSSSAAVSNIDMLFIGDLYEAIDRNPPAIEARKILIQHFVRFKWFDTAAESIQELLTLSPFDKDAILWSEVISRHQNKPPRPREQVPKSTTSESKVQINKNMDETKLELQQGYVALRSKAAKLLRETHLICELASKNDDGELINSRDKGKARVSTPTTEEMKDDTFSARFENHVRNLTALVNGKISTVTQVQQPGSARAVARDMEGSPHRAVDIAVADLDGMARWLQSTKIAISGDDLRDSLVKRVEALSTALSKDMKPYATTALMHTEHEILHRKYLCNETMLGDPVSKIPRAHFWVTEDGYPWDMDELAQAIACNGGVMRNPLSRQMFTPNDIRAIVKHPLGKHLAALEMEQKSLSQGVRPMTIDEIDKMATVLLADMSEDQMESRHVVDGFLAYIATLPLSEQKVLDDLRVPAKDSHTGQGFDTSIGEAVRDASGNRVCFHKTGDFLKQAASHLRKK